MVLGRLGHWTEPPEGVAAIAQAPEYHPAGAETVRV